MKCKHEPCNNEAQGSSLYCSKSCRAQHSRRNITSATSATSGATSEAQQGATSENEQITPESVDIDPDSAGGTCQKPHLKRNTPAYKNLDESTQGARSAIMSSAAGSSQNTYYDKHLKAQAAATPASLEDYYDPDGRQYATRTNPELLNWCEPMTADELHSYAFKHKLPHYHNRQPIPGDHDYKGACELVGTTWRVKQ